MYDVTPLASESFQNVASKTFNPAPPFNYHMCTPQYLTGVRVRKTKLERDVYDNKIC